MKPKNLLLPLLSWLSLLWAPSHITAAEAYGGAPSASPGDRSPTAGQAAAGPNTPRGGEAEPVVKLSIFEVSGSRDEGYRSSQTIHGSATVSMLRDTPNSISIINRELIDDLIATDTRELSFYMITGQVNTNVEGAFGDGHVFRGITGNIALLNGVTWFTPVDSYNIERVEILRGPTAFLYGEGTAGGLVNRLTKSALPTNQRKLNLIFGSHDLYRAEIDVNRQLSRNLAVRGAFVYQRGGTFQHHAGREIKAAYLTTSYQPFERTRIALNGEYGRNYLSLGMNLMADQYSTTERTGATAAISNTTGGYTYVPASGLFFRSTGVLRRSTGTGLAIFDENLQPRELNFNGPDGENRVHYGAASLRINQEIAENFNVQAIVTYQKADRTYLARTGSSVGRIYRDTDATLPDGRANPNFNQYYTEFYNRTMVHTEPQNNARVTAVYDLDLKFTRQKLVGTFLYADSNPQNEFYTETVDPASSLFVGSLARADNTLAAYQANRTVHTQNYFYRRFYLRDGDRTEITKKTIVPGQSVWLRDAGPDGASGRLADEFYRTPGYGFGASGTFFGDRLHTLVGWRRSSFNVSRGRDFYNYVTGLTFRVPEVPGIPQPNVIRITRDTVNYGGVFHLTKWLAGYFNYAESMALSSGVGGALLTPGQLRGPGRGDGNEYGLRWSLFDGRLESNWTYYVTNQLRISANPAIPAVVRQDELSRIFTDINPSGGDTQSTKATGFEFETVANMTKDWRLMWNLSTNDLETSDRYPALKDYQRRAAAQGTPTPETDAFLATVPDGTPLPGYTKISSNLVTQYRFPAGPLKDVMIGGGGQYRDQAYQGNFDLNRDGVAEQLWTPGYMIWNLSLGYRLRAGGRPVQVHLNINNLFDKSYYRSLAISSGVWEDGRNFRLAVRTEF